jgi:VWFA-related protein
MARFIAAPLFCCCLSWLWGQQPAPPPALESTVFRVTTSLVQVDAVVTDGKGHYVTSLKPDDFEILLDKKPQAITNLSYVDLESPSSNSNALAPATESRPASVIRPEQVRRSMVFVVDDLSLSFTSIAAVRKTLQQFVEQQMRDGDLVAIWQVGRSNGVFQQLTTDKRVLEAAIRSLRWNPRSDIFPDRTYRMTALMGLLMDELRDTGGRKAVVLMSDAPYMLGMDWTDPMAARRQEALRDLIDKANRSGTVIHTVDMRGVLYVRPRQVPSLWVSQQGMAQLAWGTGGLASFDNGYVQAVQRVEDDQRGYYLIGFKAPESLLGVAGKNGLDYHSLNVKVKGKGLQVRSRTGFWGQTDEAARLKRDTPVVQMAASMYSLYNASGIHVRAAPQFTLTSDGKPVVHNLLHIDARDVTFKADASGNNKAELDAVVVATAFGSDPVSLSRRMVIEGSSDRLKQLREKGLTLVLDVPIKHPGPYQIRASVRDSATAAIGSAGQYLEIPDLKKEHIVVTTPVLEEVPAPADKSYDASPVLREFRRGSQVSFEFAVATEKAGGNRAPTANLKAAIELYRDNKSVLTRPVAVVSTKDEGIRTVRGALQLGPALPAGQYYLKATVAEGAGQHRSASVWTDFEVVE